MLHEHIRHPRKLISHGFTITEILIAVFIVSVLAMVAIPIFTTQVNRTRVDTAAQIMLKNAQFLHKWQFITGGYRLTNKTNSNKCPYLPYQYDSNETKQHYFYLASSDAHLKGKKFVNDQAQETNLISSNCEPTEFTLRAYPICGTSVEKHGVICLDEDGNLIKNTIPGCNSNAGEKKEFYCVDDTTKDQKRENAIADNNKPSSQPSTPDSEPEEYNCKTNSADLACICAENPEAKSECKVVQFCLEHPKQAQCKCVLHSNEAECFDYCELNHEDKSCPKYCDYLENEHDKSYCDKKGKDEINCKPFPERHECYQACKYDIPKASWCGDVCKSFPDGEKSPSWCSERQTEKKYERGDEAIDSCGNVYKCINPTQCNNNLDPTLTPDGTNKTQAWQLSQCQNGLSSNFFESSATSKYKDGDIVNSSSCVSYRCNNQGGCSATPPNYNAPTAIKDATWVPCYNVCPATLKDFYSQGSYTFNGSCSASLYICMKANLCNSDNGEHQPGNEISADGSTTWRQVTEAPVKK